MLGALIVAALYSVPPPPGTIFREPERTTPFPTYSANCRLVGNDARDQRLVLVVNGVGEGRRLRLRSASGSLKRLMVFDARPITFSTGNQTMLWHTSDAFKAALGRRPVDIWLEVAPDISNGVFIRIRDRDGYSVGVPLFSGMCRATLTATESP